MCLFLDFLYLSKWQLHLLIVQDRNFEVILESSLFEYPTSNLSVNPVSSAFKIDPEPYHFLPSFDYHPSPNTHALSLDYYFSLLLGLQAFYFCPCHSTIYSLPYSEKLLLKYQVRSFYQPQILQWLPFSLRVPTLACKALHDPIAGHLSFHYCSPCTVLQTH